MGAGRRGAVRTELLEAVFGIVLHALELHLQHLVLVLQFFDGAGELAQRALDTFDARWQVAGIGLRHARRRLALIALTPIALLLRRRLTLFAAVKQIVEEVAVRLLRRRGPREQRQAKRGKRRDANWVS